MVRVLRAMDGWLGDKLHMVTEIMQEGRTFTAAHEVPREDQPVPPKQGEAMPMESSIFQPPLSVPTPSQSELVMLSNTHAPNPQHIDNLR